MKVAIILHGGAGNWQPEKIPRANEILKEAAIIGIKILKNNGSSLDAVEKAVNHLENSGYFNCGIGSIAQSDGKVRMDAGIMDGHALKCGAVASIEDIKNPISIARRLMDKTDHCLIVSKYAVDFALRNGFDKFKIKPKKFKKGNSVSSDTVGAIALDRNGRIAVANSTGGRFGKMLPGRVGDSPIAGAGFYANKFAGAATTGIGEAFIRTNAASRAVYIVEQGKSVKEAAKLAMRFVTEKTKCDGGMIILDRKGNHVACFTTKAMPWVYKFVNL